MRKGPHRLAGENTPSAHTPLPDQHLQLECGGEKRALVIDDRGRAGTK